MVQTEVESVQAELAGGGADRGYLGWLRYLEAGMCSVLRLVSRLLENMEENRESVSWSSAGEVCTSR